MSDFNKADYWFDSAEYDLQAAHAMLDMLSPLNIESALPAAKGAPVGIPDGFALRANDSGNGGAVSMDQEKVLNIARDYAASVRKVIDAADVFLYGSYARGTATKDSDIDIAIIVHQLPDDYLHTLATLWKLTRGVSDDIEPVLLTADDDKSGFLSTVRKTGIAV